MNTLRFFGILLIILIYIVLGAKFNAGNGWFFSAIPFVVLFVASAFLDFSAFILVVLASAFFVNWQATLSLEMALFTALPLICFLVRRLAAFRPMMGSLVLTAAGMSLFYVCVSWKAIVASPVFFGGVIAAGVFTAFLLTAFFNFIYAKKEF